MADLFQWAQVGSSVLGNMNKSTPAASSAYLDNSGWTLSTGGGSATGGILSWQTALAVMAGAVVVMLIKKKGKG